MQFRVTKPLKGEDTSRKPKYLSTMPNVTSKRIHNIRTLKLTNTQDKYGRPVLTLNNKRWHDPVTEAPKLGATEIWSIINPMGEPIRYTCTLFPSKSLTGVPLT